MALTIDDVASKVFAVAALFRTRRSLVIGDKRRVQDSIGLRIETRRGNFLD